MSDFLNNLEDKSIYKYLVVIVTAIAATLIAVETTTLDNEIIWYVILAETILFGMLFIDFGLHVIDNIKSNKLSNYLVSFEGIIDFIAIIPFFIIITDAESLVHLKFICGIIAFLKIARFSDALKIFRDVLINERKSLIGSLYIMLLLTFFLSTILYFIERNVNPNGFSSIISSMWWSIVTLSTVGYGDIYPITALGKFIGAIAAVVGLGMFALPAGILANGFAQELARVKFVTSWNLVAKVPLFSNLQKGTITQIAKLLHINRFSTNEMIIKYGDIGDAMYFILEGEVQVVIPDNKNKIILKPGQFFGEIALLKDTKRVASVVAKNRCRVLELTSYDFKKLVKSKPEILKKIEDVAQTRFEF